MTPADVGKVLMKCAAFDQRTIGETDIAAWSEIIGHLELASCLQAVTVHYRENATRAMPSEIRKLATDIQARQRGAGDRARRELQAGRREPTRTGRAMVTFVLGRLQAAGSAPAAGRCLGRERAAEVAEDACREWLDLTAGLPA